MEKKGALTSLFLSVYNPVLSLPDICWRWVSDFEFIIVQTLWCSSSVEAQKVDYNTDEKTCEAGKVKFQGSSFVRASFIIVFLS